MGYRILIADDDLHTRRILETLLCREPALAGPEVIGVSDGKEALAAFELQRFDLVITDLLMPRVDGFALSRAIRAHPDGKTVPLLVTSAVYKDRASLGRLEQDTSCEFFAKPFQMRELIRAVLRLLVEPNKPRAPGRAPGGGGAGARVDLPQSGTLAERGAARLLLELLDSGSTGVLTLSRAKVRKEIYILLGHPIGAESNLRNETLGQILVGRGAISPAELQQALELARDSRDRLGGILVERGLMKEAELLKYLGIQVRMKISTALRWREGTWALAPGDTFSGRITHLTVDAPQLVFMGLKTSAAPDEIAREAAEAAARQGSGKPLRFVIGPRFDKHRAAFLRVFGDGGLKLLSSRPHPGDLAARNEVQLLEQYDALLVAGLASLQVDDVSDSSGVPTTRMTGDSGGVPTTRMTGDSGGVPTTRMTGDSGGVPTRRMTGDSGGVPVGPMTQEGSGRTLARQGEARGDALYAELFGEAEGQASRPPTVDVNNEDSGVFQLPPPASKKPSTDPAVAAARDALLREYLAPPGRDHYEVLRVERDASSAQIETAFATRSREFELERWSDVDLGSDHAKLEVLNQVVREAYDTLSRPPTRAAYDHALEKRGPGAPVAAPRPGKDAAARPARVDARASGAGVDEAKGSGAPAAHRVMRLEGEGDFREGLRLLGADRPAEAAARLREAARVAPDQADYHALLGWALFQAGHSESSAAAAAATAWGSLEQALSIDPDNVAAHEFAGRIAFALGDDKSTAQHLERALHLDPARAEALATLEAVYLRSGEHDRLVRLYRSLIKRLGTARAGAMWWDLAMLLRDQLGDRDGARQALETYQRLVPDDARAREALRQLQVPAVASAGGKGNDMRRTLGTLRSAWRAAPHDPAPGRQLFRQHLDAGQPDAALADAMALLARNAADDEVQAFIRRYRPRFLQRAHTPIAWAHVDAIRHPDDDRDLATLYTRLFAAVRPPVEDRAAGMQRLGLEVLPPTFVGVLGYAAWIMGVAPPALARNLAPAEPAAADPLAPAPTTPAQNAVAPAPLLLVPLEPPVMLATPAVLALTDKIALAFRLGRALAGLYPARALAAMLPSTQLKLYLASAMALDAGMRVSSMDGAIVRLRDRLLATPTLAQEVRPLLERITSRGGTINLSRWVRGIARTAERVGLLVCNDLPVAVQILTEEGATQAASDLIDFSLSEDLATVRAALGLTVAV